MSIADPNDIEELRTLAMAHLGEAVRLAKITLEDGRVLDLEPRDVISVCQNLAKAKVNKPKAVTAPEDFQLKGTEHEEES